MGVCPRLEPGLDVCVAETEGLWYLSAAGFGALYDGTLLVFALRFSVTRAFSLGAWPVTAGALLTSLACASDSNEDNGVFLRRAVVDWESCHLTWRPVAMGFLLRETGILFCGEYLKVGGTYGLYSASLLWGSNLIVDPFPRMFEVNGSSSVGALK
jgi:hypothetical protein